jgi:hypothetical protein
MGETAVFIPSTSAREALAARFGLEYSDRMQDWEWEVADVDRFGEFLDAYCSATLPDEQRASLMEMLIQCVEEMDEPSKFASSWSAIEPLLITRAGLHRPSIAYWAKLGEIDPVAKFRVSPAMRRVWTAISG